MNKENILIGAMIVSAIILIYIAMRGGTYEGFELESAVTPNYIKQYYTKKLAQTLSEDPRNSAGEYVEFYTADASADTPRANDNIKQITITPNNCVFKYGHLNEKTYTIKIDPGVYLPSELAKQMECTLNDAENGWWVTWDSLHNRFALGTNGFKYRRWYHPQSIYYAMGLKCTPDDGLMKNMTEWMDNEVGSPLYVCVALR